MKTSSKLTYMLAIALTAVAGCADGGDGDDDGGGGGGGGGGGSGSGGGPAEGTSAVGKYRINSEFDLATNMPGTVGDIVNGFIDATDDPADPTDYLLGLAIDQMSSGTLKNILEGARAVAAGYVNDRLLDIAPDFVDVIIEIGDDFGQIAKNFGVDSVLDVTTNGNGYVAKHSVDGVRIKFDDQDEPFLMADYGGDPIVIPGVPITYDASGKFKIGTHTVPMPYGTMLRIALDEAIIPRIDPSANGLAELLEGLVDCEAMGEAIYDAIGFGSPSTFESACEAGLAALAVVVYDQINDIDSTALTFNIAGDSRATDTNADKKVDEISRGKWSGQMVYGSSDPGEVTASTYVGKRI